MKRKIVLACLCSVLLIACSRSRPEGMATSPGANSTPAPTPSADSFNLKGSLVNKDGAPAGGQEVVIYPLNRKGAPLIVQVMKEGDKPGFVGLEVWNPKSKTDASGSFTIVIPRVSQIGDDPFSDIAIGLKEPPGGWASFTVIEMQYASPEKKKEKAFVMSADGKERDLDLLRKSGTTLTINLTGRSGDLDLGKVVIE